MTPLLLALGASLAWGVADFVGPLSSRTLGLAARSCSGRRSAGSPAIAIVVAVRGEGPAGWGVLFAIAAAIGGTLGLFAYYRGMQIGAMSVVAPIAGCVGDHPGRLRDRDRRRPVALRSSRASAARSSASRSRRSSISEGSRRLAAGVGLALLAALGFGFYFPWMHAAGKVDFWWASLIFRTTALLLVASAVAVRATEPQAERGATSRSSLAVGIGDTLGNAALRRVVGRAASSA